MREFFRGWRRTIGVVTLVMACVFAALWMRSVSEHDVINLPNREMTSNVLWSRDQAIGFIITQDLYEFLHENEDIEAAKEVGRKRYPPKEWSFCGFAFEQYSAGSFGVRAITFPYWSIVMPLTLLSALLLLSKPRPPAPKTIEPAPTTGT